MHEAIHEESVKLSVGGGARGGFGGRGGSSGGSRGKGGSGTDGSGGKGGNAGNRSPTGSGSFIPIYAAGAGAAALSNQHHYKSNANYCQTPRGLLVTMGAAIMASICLSF